MAVNLEMYTNKLGITSRQERCDFWDWYEYHGQPATNNCLEMDNESRRLYTTVRNQT